MMKEPRGYTLLELIVSIAVFSMVMLVVISAYLTLISYDRQARATNDLTANLSFAIESMMRNIRTGKDYSCGASGNGTCTSANPFNFCDASGQKISYIVKSDGTLGQCTTPSSGTCESDLAFCSDASAVPLSSPSIAIQTLTFIVRGVGTGDLVQPQVMAIVKGTMGTDAGKTTSFVIETGATQRLIDI